MERDKSEKTVGRYLKISTHTLTWSVTAITIPLKLDLSDFNSHAHVERDPSVDCVIVLRPTNFNSHAHVERDQQLSALN